jgi:hypothetical protein
MHTSGVTSSKGGGAKVREGGRRVCVCVVWGGGEDKAPCLRTEDPPAACIHEQLDHSPGFW